MVKTHVLTTTVMARARKDMPLATQVPINTRNDNGLLVHFTSSGAACEGNLVDGSPAHGLVVGRANPEFTDEPKLEVGPQLDSLRISSQFLSRQQNLCCHWVSIPSLRRFLYQSIHVSMYYIHVSIHPSAVPIYI